MLDTLFELGLQEDSTYAGGTALGSRFVRALADEYSTQYFSQVAHWNVTGPNFQQLHDLFAESYELCNGSIDAIAEQARILGVFVPMTIQELLGTSSSPLPAQDSSPMAYVRQLCTCHEMLKTKWDDIAANCGSDAGANDLASSLSGKHAKMAWKFRSILSPEGQ
jgi:starvation-inducible DNA-binding protein